MRCINLLLKFQPRNPPHNVPTYKRRSRCLSAVVCSFADSSGFWTAFLHQPLAVLWLVPSLLVDGQNCCCHYVHLQFRPRNHSPLMKHRELDCNSNVFRCPMSCSKKHDNNCIKWDLLMLPVLYILAIPTLDIIHLSCLLRLYGWLDAFKNLNYRKIAKGNKYFGRKAM